MDFWEQLGAVIFDMDGVIFIGNQLRAGVIEMVDRLNALGIDFHILTNTGSSSSTEIAAKLAGMGLKVEARRITTSSALTQDTWLSTRAPTAPGRGDGPIAGP